ncbi:MAG: CatA-like O-acetyltransferase, partial [Calditrichaceae bacterium]
FKDEMSTVLQKNSEDKESLDARADEDNMIHYSVIPWIAFTGLSHSRRFGREDSIPKIVFGKYQTKNGRLMMPISVEVHHSLMDALHVSRYLTRLQEILDQPEKELGK